MLLAKLEEAELGERAALGEASRVREDNEGLKVSHRVGIAMMGFLQEKRGKGPQNALSCCFPAGSYPYQGLALFELLVCKGDTENMKVFLIWWRVGYVCFVDLASNVLK